MSKPFGLVLALAAAGAHAEAGGESGLVVSALFGTEPPPYVHAAVANVLGFTLPTTKIVVHKKVPWYRRHGHANATLARRHRGNATGFLRHRRHANATRLHHRRHPRRHNRDGLGAPTPGDAVDGVVVAASAPHERIERTGISSGLEALAALHRKGALTDSEFAAAKAKLLG